MVRLSAALAGSLFMSPGLLAQQPPAETDSTAQQLMELLNTPVTVASKSAERSSDAAASISSYKASFIEQMGIYTLGELAQVTPGYGAYSIYGEQVFETRGQKAGSFNNNDHLLLVDGIPVANVRSNKVPTEEEMPLQFARQVEFLRGPASSLYGIGAFFGVVSITPKASDQGTTVETLAGAGNDGEARRVMSTITHGSEAGETLMAMSLFSKANSGAFAGQVDDPQNLYQDRHATMFMTLSHKVKAGPLEGLGLGAIYTYKSGGLGEMWNGPAGDYTNPTNQITWVTFIPYLKYQRKLSDTLAFNAYLKSNNSEEKGAYSPLDRAQADNFSGTGTVYGLYDINVQDYEALAELQWNPDPTFNLVAGLDYDDRWQKGAVSGAYNLSISADPGNPYPGGPVGKTGDYRTESTYAQAKKVFPVLAGLDVVAGVRLDKGDAPGNSYSQVSPRLGLVQKLTDRFNLKAMYGTALIAPGIKEVELNNETKANNPGLTLPSLGAETFKTFEVAATYSALHYTAALTYFSNQTDNSLNSVQTTSTGGLVNNYFANSSGVIKAKGMEAELRIAPSLELQGWVNASFAKAQDPTGHTLDDVPAATGSAGLAYTLATPVPLQVSGALRYVGPFRVSDPAMAQPSGATFLDCRVGLPPKDGLGLSLEARNLTNKLMKYPQNGIPMVPAPGRTFMLNAWVKF